MLMASNLKAVYLSQGEIDEALYCLESCQIDYTDETKKDFKDFSSLLNKLSEV